MLSQMDNDKNLDDDPLVIDEELPSNYLAESGAISPCKTRLLNLKSMDRIKDVAVLEDSNNAGKACPDFATLSSSVKIPAESSTKDAKSVNIVVFKTPQNGCTYVKLQSILDQEKLKTYFGNSKTSSNHLNNNRNKMGAASQVSENQSKIDKFNNVIVQTGAKNVGQKKMYSLLSTNSNFLNLPKADGHSSVGQNSKYIPKSTFNGIVSKPSNTSMTSLKTQNHRKTDVHTDGRQNSTDIPQSTLNSKLDKRPNSTEKFSVISKQSDTAKPIVTSLSDSRKSVYFIKGNRNVDIPNNSTIDKTQTESQSGTGNYIQKVIHGPNKCNETIPPKPRNSLATSRIKNGKSVNVNNILGASNIDNGKSTNYCNILGTCVLNNKKSTNHSKLLATPDNNNWKSTIVSPSMSLIDLNGNKSDVSDGSFDKEPSTELEFESVESYIQPEIGNLEPVRENGNLEPVSEPVCKVRNLEPMAEVGNFEPVAKIRNFKPVSKVRNVEPASKNGNKKVIGGNNDLQSVREKRNSERVEEIGKNSVQGVVEVKTSASDTFVENFDDNVESEATRTGDGESINIDNDNSSNIETEKLNLNTSVDNISDIPIDTNSVTKAVPNNKEPKIESETTADLIPESEMKQGPDNDTGLATDEPVFKDGVKIKAYACQGCWTVFENHYSLEKHVCPNKDDENTTKQIEKQRHNCEHCEKVFTDNSVLKRHLKSHTGIKEYMCDLCGKFFLLKHHLVIHIADHISDRPYVCQVCSMAFKRWPYLRKHRFAHTRNRSRNYQCTNCDKAFYYLNHLNSHLLTHETNPNRYTCDICKCSFSRRFVLDRHMRWEHSDGKNASGTKHPQDGKKRSKAKRKRELLCKFCDKPFLLCRQIKLHLEYHNVFVKNDEDLFQYTKTDKFAKKNECTMKNDYSKID
ncbi:hypothetical protein ACF0H5_022370 [Mactra antiquata]